MVTAKPGEEPYPSPGGATEIQGCVVSVQAGNGHRARNGPKGYALNARDGDLTAGLVP